MRIAYLAYVHVCAYYEAALIEPHLAAERPKTVLFERVQEWGRKKDLLQRLGRFDAGFDGIWQMRDVVLGGIDRHGAEAPPQRWYEREENGHEAPVSGGNRRVPSQYLSRRLDVSVASGGHDVHSRTGSAGQKAAVCADYSLWKVFPCGYLQPRFVPIAGTWSLCYTLYSPCSTLASHRTSKCRKYKRYWSAIML